MSHILAFNVEGLAGRSESFAQELNRDVNILFGTNGSGKTSLLKILDSAFRSDASSLVNVPFKSAEVIIESIHYKKRFRYTLDKASLKLGEHQAFLYESAADEFTFNPVFQHLTLHDNRQKRQKPFGWKVEPALPKDASGTWHHRYLTTSRLVQEKSATTKSFGKGEDFYDAMFADALERHWNEFFGGVQSEVRQLQEKGIANILSEVLSPEVALRDGRDLDWQRAYERTTAFLSRQKIVSMLPKKKDFEKQFRTSGVLQRVVEQIDDLEGRIARVMEPRTKLQALVERLFSGNKRLLFLDTKVEVVSKDDAKIGLQSLSSGEKHILRILFEVLVARDSTLIIDEPEISLHIDWQRELIRAIRELNPNLQLIFATHSPEIMAEIEDTKIFQIPS